MAVDGNVLVFERTKEEFQGGRPLRTATREGFSKAFSAIADSNVTTLIAAALLYFFASGGVRGFGVTLSIGVLVSMFTSLVVTRVLIELSVRSKFLTSRPKLWGLEVGADLRQRIVSRGPDIVGNKKRWFTITAGASLLAVSGILIFGLTYGLDFTGGRLIEYPAEGGVDLEEVRAGLADVGFPRAVVQETGEQNVSIRTRQLSEEEEAAVDEAVAAVIGTDEHIRDEFVGPTIGDEIRQRALIALALALGAQLLYLAIRFRWTFGAAAVVAMFHDLAIVVGLFAWLGKELDGVFVAALLTVIGYSVNDTVVIFDRIREERLLRPKDPFDQVANTAALETLPRTINTGLSTLFILVGLYLLGGDTLADFALALIVGVLVGTYSSVGLATPLAAYLEGRWEAPPPDTGRGSSSRPAKRPVKRPVSTTPGAASTSTPGGAAPVPPRQRKKGR
jgi:SecD/SecF fusion protein